jgi:hypothetical protein
MSQPSEQGFAMTSPAIPPAPQPIRRAWVFAGVGVTAVIAIVVPAICRVQHEAVEARRAVRLADLTLVIASEVNDEWPAADVQADCPPPGPGLLALFAKPPENQPAVAQPGGDESAPEDATFDPTWGNGEEPNWDFSEAQPVRRMPAARRYAPVNPAQVARWWAAKPEPRRERRVKRPLPLPAVTRVVPLPSVVSPGAAVD